MRASLSGRQKGRPRTGTTDGARRTGAIKGGRSMRKAKILGPLVSGPYYGHPGIRPACWAEETLRFEKGLQMGEGPAKGARRRQLWCIEGTSEKSLLTRETARGEL